MSSAWQSTKNAARVTADAAWGATKRAATEVAAMARRKSSELADAARRKGDELADSLKKASVRAALYAADHGRKLSKRAARGVQQALLGEDDLTDKMKSEYTTSLDRLLRVQTWLEVHAPDWLREQVANPQGRHLQVRVHPDDVHSLQPGRRKDKSPAHKSPARAPPLALEDAVDPDRGPAAFCTKFECGSDSLKKCRKKRLHAWHPDKHATADEQTRQQYAARTSELNAWSQALTLHPGWKEHRCVT